MMFFQEGIIISYAESQSAGPVMSVSHVVKMNVSTSTSGLWKEQGAEFGQTKQPNMYFWQEKDPDNDLRLALNL